jgi:1-deoxy-D-xylulose-5-phosphate reductoisomerase
LDVVRRWPERFGIYALVAGRNTDLLAKQIEEFRPQVAVVADENVLQELKPKLGSYVPGSMQRELPRLDL